MQLVLAFACATTDVPSTDTGSPPVDSATVSLVPEVTQGGDTPVRRVRWTTETATTGWVEYGIDGLTARIDDDVESTEHDVIVAGIAAGYEWQLRVVSEAGGSRWASEVLDMEAVYAPPSLPVPTLSVPPDEAIEGFELVPLPAVGGASTAVLNRLGEPVWWTPNLPQSVYRARYDSTHQTISWVALNTETQTQTFITSSLDREEVRVPAPPDAHADFALLPEGGFLVLALEDHDVDGVTVRAETLQEVQPDGTTRRLWGSWEHFEWPGDGHKEDSGAIQWPHANSLTYDADRRKVLVSLFYLDAIAQIDRDTGEMDWLLGGDLSDWTVLGDGFAGQHAPEVYDGGRSLVLMNNGAPGAPAEAAIAMAYDLDPDTLVATPRWTFDDDAGHTGVILGNVSWLGDDDTFVNWGSAGVMQRVSAAGEVRWQLDFSLAQFAEFGEHLPDLAGATR